MANIGMGTGNVPESARAIASTKKDLIVCQACLCNTLYIDQNHGLPCCAEHGQLCCFARDHICIGEDTSKFATCSLLGLTCYPKFSCCQPLSHYYDAATHPAVKEKADYYPIFGYCMAGLCFQQPPVFQTIYLKTPTTCLSNDGICCCILHGDCAIPCDEGVPVACTLFYTGLLLYPKVACCTKAGDVFTVKEPLVGGPEIIHGAPRFSDLVEKHVFKKQPEPEESRGETADVA